MVEIPFVKVVSTGFACLDGQCHFAAPTMKTMRNHIYVAHGTRSSEMFQGPVKLQQLYSSGNRAWFPVVGKDEAIIEITPYSALLQTLPNDLRADSLPIADLEERDLTPFLRRSGWDRHVQGFVPKDLIALVALPNAKKEPTFDRTRHHILAYFRNTQMMIRESKNLLVLKLINSDNSTEINHDPFKALQQNDSLERYAGYMTRLVCFLLRWKGGAVPQYRLVLSAQQDAWCERLDELCRTECQTEEFNAVFHPLAHSLLTHTTPQAVLDPWEYPLYCFLAISNLRPTGSFAAPTDITPNLAAIQWCFKAVVFRNIQQMVFNDVGKQAAEVELAIKKECEVLYDGHLSPYASLLGLKHLVNSMAYRAKSLPNVYWQNREKTALTVNGASLTLDGIRNVISALEAEATTLLRDQLFLGMQLDSLPVAGTDGSVMDELPEDRPGYSFLTDSGNPFHEKKWALARHLVESPGISPEFHAGVYGNSIAWNVQRILKYVTDGAKFMDVMAVLIHLTYGGPARRPELLQTLHQNMPGVARNVYFIFGRVCLIARYHKGSNLTGQDKSIPRFLPASVSKLLILYLAYVRPIEVLFLRLTNQVEKAAFHKHHLFSQGGESWDPNHFTSLLSLAFLRNTGVSVNTATWRHAAIAIANSKAINIEGEKQESAVHLQAAHQTSTAEMRYAVDADSLHDVHQSDLLMFRDVSLSWQEIIGYQTFPEFNAPESLEDLVRRVIREEIQKAGTENLGGLGGRTASVPSSSLAPVSAPGVLERYEQEDLPIPALPSSPVLLPPRLRLPILDLPPDIYDSLSKLFPGETPSFKTDFQRDGCALVMTNADNAMLVGPTSSGKSLFWLVPVVSDAESSKVTVVVVPLRALLTEFLAKARALRIRADRWSNQASSHLKLVFVSVEVAVTDPFMCWARSLGARLARIVYEEAHLVITAPYRDKMASLITLRTLAVPMYIITATAPPSLRLALLDRFGLSAAMLHAVSTQRSQIAYKVTAVATDLLANVRIAIETLRPKMSLNAQLIIFCNDRSTVELLHNALPCSVGHHSGMTEEERLCSIDALEDGRAEIMVTTSGLAAGVNFTGVEAVVHAGTPFSLVDFAQESGRVGRKDQSSFSWVIPTGVRDIPSPDTLGIASLNDWMTDAVDCRRSKLSMYLDGVRIRCDDLPLVHLCDRCERAALTVSCQPVSPQRLNMSYSVRLH